MNRNMNPSWVSLFKTNKDTLYNYEKYSTRVEAITSILHLNRMRHLVVNQSNFKSRF